MTKCPCGYQTFSILQWEAFFLDISIFWFRTPTFSIFTTKIYNVHNFYTKPCQLLLNNCTMATIATNIASWSSLSSYRHSCNCRLYIQSESIFQAETHGYSRMMVGWLLDHLKRTLIA